MSDGQPSPPSLGSLLGRARGPSSPTFRRSRCALVSHAVHVALTAAHTPVCDRRGGCLTTECVPAGTPASAHVTSVTHMTHLSLARRVDGVATPTAPHAIRSRVTDAPRTRSSGHLTTPVSTSQVCCCFWRCRPPSSVRRWNSRLVAHLFIAAQRQTLSCTASQMAHTDFLLVQSCLEIAQ